MDRTKLGVMILTHSGHRRFLKPCLESCKKMNPGKIVVVYDTRFTGNEKLALERTLPTYDTLILADHWHIADIGPRVGSWLFEVQFGSMLLQALNMEHVFSINGDCIVDIPEGIDDICNVMEKENAEVICCELRGADFAGTTSWFAKTDIAVDIGNHLVKYAYESRTPEGKGFGNAEGRMGKAISMQGFKCAPIRNPENAQLSYGDRGTFGDLLEFRHLHGSEKWRKSNYKEPFPKEYYDLRYVEGNERNGLEYFWETGKTDKLIELGYWR